MKNSISPFRILIVEDNPPDVELFRFMFSKTQVAVELSFVKNGIQASDFVNRRSGFEDRATAELILMDLNIPLKDGRELLGEFKQHPDYRRVPIIMVTTSNSDQEIQDCYQLGANAFISKPVDIEEFQNTINKLVAFWLTCVELPSRPGKH